MTTLIVGHSQTKYFSEYLRLDNVHTLSFPGAKVEDVGGNICDFVEQFDIVVLHLGANNFPSDSASEVAWKYWDLLQNCVSVTPAMKLIVSSITPRSESNYSYYPSEQVSTSAIYLKK